MSLWEYKDGPNKANALPRESLSGWTGKEACVGVLESALTLMSFDKAISKEFLALSTITACLKVVHHWQSGQVKRVAQDQNEAHTLRSHINILSITLLLFIIDITLMLTVLGLLSEEPSMAGYAIVADCMSLTPMLWLIIAEYSLSCYHHWSDQDTKSLKWFQSSATIVCQAIKVLNCAAFFSLQYKFGKVNSNMALQLTINTVTLLYQILQMQTQRLKIQAVVSKLQTLEPHSKSMTAATLCVICRDSLLSDPSVDVSDCSRPSAHPIKALDCGHIYHQHCLISWLQYTLQCPTCREVVI